MRPAKNGLLALGLAMALVGCASLAPKEFSSLPSLEAAHAAPASQPAALTDTDIRSLMHENYYTTHLKGKRVGSSVRSLREEIRKDFHGVANCPVYVLSVESEIWTGHMGMMKSAEIGVYSRQAPYALLERTFSATLGEPVKTSAIIKEDEGYRSSASDKGAPSKEDADPELRYTLSDALALFAWARGLPPKGTRLEHRFLMASPELAAHAVTAQATRAFSRSIGGASVNAISAERLLPYGAGRELLEIDENGRVLRTLLDGGMEERLATKEEALNKDYIEKWFSNAASHVSNMM